MGVQDGAIRAMVWMVVVETIGLRGAFSTNNNPMTKLFVPVIFVSLLAAACTTDSKKEQAENKWSSLKYDTSKTAIIHWNKSSRYIFDSLNHEATTLTQEDLRKVDSLLVSCVTNYNSSLSNEHDDFKIDWKDDGYKKQLVVVTNEKSEKKVWVNCFCDDWDKHWKTEILTVEDGGPCYFNFKINLTTKIIYDLMINGFA